MRNLAWAAALLALIPALTRAGCPATMQWDRDNFCILIQPFEQMHDQIEKTDDKAALVADVGGALDSFRKALDNSKDSPGELEVIAVQALLVKLTMAEGIASIKSGFTGFRLDKDLKKHLDRDVADYEAALAILKDKMSTACQDPNSSTLSFCADAQPFCGYVAKIGTANDPHHPTTDNIPAIMDGKALFKKTCPAK